MERFSVWLEGEEPQMSHEWGATGRFVKLTVRLRLPGHRNDPAHFYMLPDEVGSLELEQTGEMPEYLFAAGVSVNPKYQRLGYAQGMYRYALGLAKGRGFKGIISAHERVNGRGRSGPADGLWNHLRTRRDSEWDYMV